MILELNDEEIAQIIVDWMSARGLIKSHYLCNVEFEKRDDGRVYAVARPLHPAEPAPEQPPPMVGGMISRQALKDMATAGEAYPEEEH